MDAVAANDLGSAVARLPEHEKQELQQFIRNETQKSNIQAAIHQLTDMCFRKCITSKITSKTLDKYEEPCMVNCVERFVDGGNLVIQHMESLRN